MSCQTIINLRKLSNNSFNIESNEITLKKEKKKWYNFLVNLLKNFQSFTSNRNRKNYENYQQKNEIEESNHFINFLKYSALIGIFFYLPLELLISGIQKQYNLAHYIFAILWVLIFINFSIFLPWVIKICVHKYKELDKQIRMLRITFALIFTFGPIAGFEYYIIPYEFDSFLPKNKYNLFWVSQHLFCICLPMIFLVRKPIYQIKLFILNYFYFSLRISIADYIDIGDCIKNFLIGSVIVLMITCFLSFREKQFKENFVNFDYIKRMNEEWNFIFSCLPQTVLIIDESKEIIYYSEKLDELKQNVNFVLNSYENLNIFLQNCKTVTKKENVENHLTLFEIMKEIQEKNEDLLIKNENKNVFNYFIFPTNNKDIELELKIIQIKYMMKKCWLFLIEDISERNMYLKKTNEFKNKLISSFSHEFKTPINGANAQIENILSDIKISEEIKNNYVIPLKQNLEMLEYFVNDFIDIGSFSTNEFVLFNSETDIINISKEISEIIEPMAKIKNLEYKLDIDKNIQVIQNDGKRIKQIMMNLLRNSLKFSKNGIIVMKISIEKLPNELDNNIDYIKIEVIDSGIGMTEDQQVEVNRILFTHDLSNLANLNLTGNGVGLIISQCIAIEIGPKTGLFFHSEKNKGSSFYFYLEDKKFNLNNFEKIKIDQNNENELYEFETLQNICEEQHFWEKKNLKKYNFFGEKESLNNNTQTCNCSKILLVDDEPFNLLALELILKKMNISFQKSFSGFHAIEVIENYLKTKKCENCKGIELILMDIQMPELNGIEATIKIIDLFNKYKKNVVPIVACTAFNSKNDVENCFKAGMSEFITKPITKENLLKIFKQFNFGNY